MKKWNKLTIFLIPIGIAVNVVGGQLAIMLKLPVYLDSIGTLVVGALCGILPGIIVAVGTQLINAITLPTVLAYTEIGVLFAIPCKLFCKMGCIQIFAEVNRMWNYHSLCQCRSCSSDHSLFPWWICWNRSICNRDSTDDSRMGRSSGYFCQ